MSSTKQLSPEELKKINKILIIQQKPFGDILLNTGYFGELRRHFPEAQIDYLVQKPYKTILEDNPHLDNLVLMEKAKGLKRLFSIIATIFKIRKTGYDLIIDQIRGTSSVRLIAFSGARWRLGFKLPHKKRMGITFKRWNWLYNLKVPKGNVRYYSRMKFDVLKPLGISEVEHNIYYHIRPESFNYVKSWLKQARIADEKLIVFSAGTPVKKKQWDLENYAKLGDLIRQKLEIKVVLLWGPGEKEDAEYINNKMEAEAIIAPPTSFNEAGALLHFANLLVTNDGGINHLAVSQRVPSLAIFGPASNPKKWCAWHRPEHLYLRDWSFKKRDVNHFNITAEQALEKVEELLQLSSETS